MTSSQRAALTIVDEPDTRRRPQVPRATLSDVTDAVLKILRPDLARRGRQLVVEVTETSQFLAGDPSSAAQVLADLLDSASRHSQTDRIMVRVVLEREQVVIKAREQGLGIGLPLARQLTESYGHAISCSVATGACSSEIVVRVPVPVAEDEADESEHPYDWEAQTLLALAITERPQSSSWRG